MRDASLPATQRGLKVLGTPLGTDEFVAAHLDSLSAQHRTFLELLPTLPDLQVAWLLLLYCACPRAQYVLRILPPALTAAFAAEHDHRILSCLAQLLQVEASSDSPLPALVARRAHLPLRLGGLGLRVLVPTPQRRTLPPGLTRCERSLAETGPSATACCMSSPAPPVPAVLHLSRAQPSSSPTMALRRLPGLTSLPRRCHPMSFRRKSQPISVGAGSVLHLKFWTTTMLQRLPKPATRPPGHAAVPRGAVRRARLHRPPHQPRSPLGLRGIPPAPPASTALAAPTRLSHLPVRSTPRLSWRSPGRLPPRWTFAFPGCAFGASSCQGLPRGRSHCCSQCFAPRPQCHRTAPR